MSYRDNNFTKEQIKGLAMSVKAVSKKFYFIKDWNFADDYERYSSIIYINLYVDMDLVSKYTGYEMKPVFKKMLAHTPKELSGSLLMTFGESDDSEELKKKSLLSVNIKEEIETSMNVVYEHHLPEELKIYYDLMGNKDTLIKIGIDNFIPIQALN